MTNMGAETHPLPDRPTGLLTYAEAARMLGVTPAAIQQAINRGSLHPLKLPRRRRKFLRHEEVLRYQGTRRRGRAALASTSRMTESASALARQELLEVLRFVFLAAGAAWSAHAAAMRDATFAMREATVAAQQLAAANMTSISETVIATVDRCLIAIGTLGAEGATPLAGLGAIGNRQPGTSGDDAAATQSLADHADASGESHHGAPTDRTTNAADWQVHLGAFAQTLREGISRQGALSERDAQVLQRFEEWARTLG